MNPLQHFGIRKDRSRNMIVKVHPLTRKELNYDEYKNKRCAECGKKGTKEEYGGHLCSAECQQKEVEREVRESRGYK